MGQDYSGSVIIFGCQGDVVGQCPGRIEVDIRLDQGIIIIKRIFLVADYRSLLDPHIEILVVCTQGTFINLIIDRSDPDGFGGTPISASGG